MWDQILKRINLEITPYKAANLWDADPDSLKIVNVGINIVGRFETNKQGRYLKIIHAKLRSKEEITASVDYLSHLYKSGAPVCAPIKSQQGNFIEAIAQEDDVFLATVTDEIKGERLDFESHNAEIYKAWGIALAKLHQAAEIYRPAAKCHFLTWQDLHAETKNYVKNEAGDIKEEFRQIDHWLNHLQETKHNFGLIHTDNRSENIILNGKEAFIVDFDEPVYHWFAADVARPLLEFHDKLNKEIQYFLKYYIQGYRSIRQFSDEEMKNLNWFMRMKDLAIYLWSKNNLSKTTVLQK